MINLNPDELIEWDGFDVYDAETGEKLYPEEVAERECEDKSVYKHIADGFALDWEGCFFFTTITGEKRYIPAREHYIIQFPDGKFMRW